LSLSATGIARNSWRVSFLACSIELPKAGIWGTLRDFITQNVKINFKSHTLAIQIIVTCAKSLIMNSLFAWLDPEIL